VPASFLEHARGGSLSPGALAFFGPPGPDEGEAAEARALLNRSRNVTPFSPPQQPSLDLPVTDPLLRSILLEEWAFLQQPGWVVSRLRRPFRTYLRAGAAALELGEGTPIPDDLPEAKWAALGERTDALRDLLPARPAGLFLLFGA
jgi:hypothetical protein